MISEAGAACPGLRMMPNCGGLIAPVDLSEWATGFSTCRHFRIVDPKQNERT